jgi:tRNA A-37 threonylcarbamoyl transferase component Bud32
MPGDEEKRFFRDVINNWQDWSRVFKSIPAFLPLIEHIYAKEKLPFSRITLLTPGTNAVFEVGNTVIKLFAPVESGMDQTITHGTESFALTRMKQLGIPVPEIIAEDLVRDKYQFAYMITEYIKGVEFAATVKNMTDDEKLNIGRKLRVLTDTMNTPCAPFNDVDVIKDGDRSLRWDRYAERFRRERVAYIESHDFGEKVFVHGDLCGDNIMVLPNGTMCIIDFADAVLAPKDYEQALVAVELFNFDAALLRGYFGNYSAEALTELCFNGLLIHEYGGDIVDSRVGRFHEIDTLGTLKELLSRRIQNTA